MKVENIMIVEDSEPEQFLCRSIIEEYDPSISIHQVYDGKQALALLTTMEKSPEIILLDINMPGMNGYEFLEAHEHNFSHAHTIIIMLTSSNQERDKTMSDRFKAVKKYVEKPLNKQALKDVIALVPD